MNSVSPLDGTPDGVVPLPHWGVIRATGADALKFLQGQLTNDVLHLPSSQARLAGFCSAKGRLQASFIVWTNSAHEVLLACSASVLPAVIKRLSMFVMRAQCKLNDASHELPLYGAVGATARTLMADAPVWGLHASPAGIALRLPDSEHLPRCLLVREATDPLPSFKALPFEAWRVLEVCSGIPTIVAATVDQFVPQMLNFELIGGVDFQKGCYPGQEVVARSQYRGTLKRRMFLFDCADASAQAGQEVFHSEDREQPAGMVVDAQAMGSDAVALVELKIAALEQHGRLHLGTIDGPLLRQRPLPYALPID